MKKLTFIAFVGLMCISMVYIVIQSPRLQTQVWKPAEMEEDLKNTESTVIQENYIEYGPLAISQNKGRKIVLFFHATWCPTCKAADKAFKSNLDKIPENVTVIKVNYNDPDTDDAEKNLAVKYGITYQHTFVQIDDSGKEITKWNGGDTSNLVGNIK